MTTPPPVPPADVPRTIASPCVGVCQIDRETKFCLGCWRTIEEIAHWARYGDPQRREVLERLRERQGAAGQDRRRVTRRRQARLDAGSLDAGTTESRDP